MKVLNLPNHSPYLHLNVDEDFRNNLTLHSRRSGTPLFLSTYLNPVFSYEIITEQLIQGTHKFRLTTFDNLNNISGNTDTTVVIGAFVLPPRFIAFSSTGSDVTLTWEHSKDGAPTNYVIYSNGGSGNIDRIFPFAVISGPLKTFTASSLIAGFWKFVVEAKVGTEESFNLFIQQTDVPSTAIVPPAIFDDNNFLLQPFAENASVGKIHVKFVWPFGTIASKFRLFHDSGTGTINFGSPIEFTRQNQLVQDFTTAQIYTGVDDKEFKFVIRVVTPDFIEETNTIEHSVILDGVAPDTVTNLTGGSTF